MVLNQNTQHKGTFDEHLYGNYKRLLHRKVVAHNRSFDQKRVKTKYFYIMNFLPKGLMLHKNWECTVKLSRSLGVFMPNKLSGCCSRLI